MSEPMVETEIEEGALKDLRRAAARSKDLERENAELRRDQAFRRSGIDPDDKRVSYFVKGYDGDLTPDAIRKEATEAGFLAPPQPDPQQQQALDGQQRIQQVVATGVPAGGVDPETLLEEAFKTGGSAGLMAALQGQGIPISQD